MVLFSQNGLTYVTCLGHLTHCPRELAAVWSCILAISYLCIATQKGTHRTYAPKRFTEHSQPQRNGFRSRLLCASCPCGCRKLGYYSMSKRSAWPPGIRMAAPRLYFHPLTRSHSSPMQSVSSMIC